MTLEIITHLFDVASVAAVLGTWVRWLITEKRKQREEYIKQITDREATHTEEVFALKNEISAYANDYKQMAGNAIKVITLADDKLKKQEKDNLMVRDIHRMVEEMADILKKNSNL